MTAQIRPNRMEVSDRFPMLGFAVRVDEPNVEAEVVLANDIALFSPENKARRTAANFYSSREHGTLMVPRGDGVFVVAPEVLARFIGSEKLHFGLATGRSGNGGLKVDALPREGSPYVSLRGFTGRTLRRSFGSGRLAGPPRLEWTGDAARPGSESVAPARNGNGNGNGHANGSSNGATAVGAPAPTGDVGYDDGFGPLPAIPARESAYRGAGARTSGHMGMMLSSGTTAAQVLERIRRATEAAVDVVGTSAAPPTLYRLGDSSGEFVSIWEKALWVAGLANPVYALLGELPGLARTSGVTLSIGPQLDTPLFGGGVGVVFAPDGQVALFGAGEVSVSASGLAEFVSSLKLALTAQMKLGYNRDGLDGFASIGKVAGIDLGEGIVGGAEVWLDTSGVGLGGAVKIGGGMALQLAAAQQHMPATGLVFDGEDMERARTVARHHRDLFQWMPPQNIVDQMKARGFEIQRIADAIGDLNLDHYQIRIDRFPDGWDGQRLLQHFIRHINDFVDTGNTSFTPYGPSDVMTLASANPLGTVFNLNIVGPDDAAVVISAAEAQYYAVTTIRTPDTGDHPVSGHRQFGYFIEDGITTFYTRGADRSTMPIPGTEWVIWQGAESLWQSFQQKVAAWVSSNGGSATILPPFSQRFNPTAMRLTYGHFDTAQSLALEEPAAATPAIVPPPLPTDPRARANRIGGQFGPRIGEALDLGLQAKALDALLDTLDPPPAAQPMSYRPRASAMNAPTWSINWDGVDLVPQPTALGCWATTLAMLIGWRDQKSIMPAGIAQQCGRDIANALPWAERAAVARTLGLGTVQPQCYLPEGFAALIENHGPLYVGKIMSDQINAGHAVLVVGMYTDGQSYFVRIVDPMDRPVGTPGSPGAYASPPTHTTGSRYIMRYEDFQHEYEMAAAGNPAFVQIIYGGVPFGRTINRATTPPAGYAMSASRSTIGKPSSNSLSRRVPATALTGPGVGATIAIEIGSVLAGQIISSSGTDITYQVDEYRGWKRPTNSDPQAPLKRVEESKVTIDWDDGGILSAIGLKLDISWEHDGWSLGNVVITPHGFNDAIGDALFVRAQISETAKPFHGVDPTQVPQYLNNPGAMLKITITYRRERMIRDDVVEGKEILLLPTGQYAETELAL